MIKRAAYFFFPSYSRMVSLSPRLLLSLTLFLTFSFSSGQQWGDYTFYSTQNSTSAVLLDTNGTTVHTWTFSSSARTGYSSYLLPGGTVLRTVARQGNSFQGGAICGQVQKVDWDGNVLWNYICSTTTYCSHHDICPMPNGNVILIVYELKSASQVTQAGCQWSHTMWPDMLMEIQPTGSSTGTVVWEWHAWDHLVQQYNPAKDNYGIVADHPELLDLNYNNSQQTTDWMHVNGIDYNEALDQIVISSHFLNELYVIDHSTTTEEAAGHTGGNSGKGGDILYRWGNPAAYDASGTNIFHVVHDAHWIPPGHARAGALVGFNNNGISNNQSAVDMFFPPYNGYNYDYTPGTAYTPSTYKWRHACNGHTNSEGGAQNLPNGNILVCITQAGFIYEIDSNNTVLWQKSLGGMGSTNARRYTKCYVEGTLIPAPAISLHDDTLFASYGVTYQWYMNGTILQGENHQFMVPMRSGNYQVKVTDAGGCESELSDPYDYEISGIGGTENESASVVYPVPTTGWVTINENINLENIENITIFDRSGRSVMTSKAVRSIDLSGLENGIYYMVMTSSDKIRPASKIILIK